MSVTPTPLLLTKPRRPAARFSGADTVLLKDTLYSSPIICSLLGVQSPFGFIKLFLLSVFYFGAEDQTQSLAHAKLTDKNQAKHSTPSCYFQHGYSM